MGGGGGGGGRGRGERSRRPATRRLLRSASLDFRGQTGRTKFVSGGRVRCPSRRPAVGRVPARAARPEMNELAAAADVVVAAVTGKTHLRGECVSTYGRLYL